ncbi:diguanylate cyclase [Kosakonia oryzendophytica]|uniref:diguanylate cyclase n=1 Tax=Kosakonia oryzendophytica TaxID=1005665 RepID=UPI000A68A0F3|nr:diguanylate cyclase [Kosakonia oryzendophytica]WBT57160.1 diguanylate cyclase [Kosakonia oryzendophytica]
MLAAFFFMKYNDTYIPGFKLFDNNLTDHAGLLYGIIVVFCYYFGKYYGEEWELNREYKYIDATISGLNKSSDAHFKWLVNVLYYVSKKHDHASDITSCNAHERCEFGIWLQQKLNEDRDDKSYLQDIYHKHVGIHEKCRELLAVLTFNEASADAFEAFASALLAFNQSLTLYKTHLLQRRTSFDTLTGLPLRRTLDESFEKTSEKFAKEGLYLLLLDIDHFKKINDNYGHLTGDLVLRALAIQLEDETRKCESVYRYGGEEFIILLHASSDEDAFAIAERIRLLVANTEIAAGDHSIKITFTAGLTQVHENESLHRILERADKALYHGKHTGRNRCVYVNRYSDMYNIAV